MSNQNQQAFISVFNAAFKKCFGTTLERPLSEAESKHFSNAIWEATGLVIGAKSLKNYSAYVLGSEDAKEENPSVATLDTLARYVLDIPFSDELQRKEKEGHYPYWFTYKSRLNTPVNETPVSVPEKQRAWRYLVLGLVIIFVGALFFSQQYKVKDRLFIEQFKNLSEDTLAKHGWLIQAKEPEWWLKRDENTPGITLYTLRGDNWPDSANTLGIKNLMIKKLESDCFSAELHLDDFIPIANWQQAGLLLMEDTTFTGKSIRISIAYNDYFGGYTKPKEIIIQGFRSVGKNPNKPEEIAHIPLFSIRQNADILVKSNLRHSALRIEKSKDQFRFLYSASAVENSALKEAFAKPISIQPKYIGVFALQGFVNNTRYTPVHISFFSLSNDNCKD